MKEIKSKINIKESRNKEKKLIVPIEKMIIKKSDIKNKSKKKEEFKIFSNNKNITKKKSFI